MGITSTWCFSLIVPYKVKEHLWQEPKCLEDWLFLKTSTYKIIWYKEYLLFILDILELQSQKMVR